MHLTLKGGKESRNTPERLGDQLLDVMFGQRARRSLDRVSGYTLHIIPMPLSLMLDLVQGENVCVS